MGARSLVTAVLCFLAFFAIQVAGSSQENSNLTLADIPPCGLQCLLVKVSESDCLPTDVDCVCQSKELTRSISECMLANCTMQESLDTARVQSDLCNLSDDSQTTEVVLYTSIVYSIAVFFVVLRLIGKSLSKRISWDDLAVVGSLMTVTIPLGLVLHMASKGFGEHIWNLQDKMLSPILFELYVSWSIYVIVLCSIKVSLVLFYLEIFTTPRFRKIAYTVLAFIVINSIAIFLVATLPCRPLAAFWNRDIKGGKCINIQAAAYANSACALVQDIILLILPLAFLRNLQMKRYRKIAVGLMFSIGTFGAVATIMRLPSLSTFKISLDPTWDYVAVTKWSQLELAAGVLCLSLPSIRIIFAMIIPASVKEMLSMNTFSKAYGRSDPGSAPKSNNSNNAKIHNNSNVHKEIREQKSWGNVSKVSHPVVTVQEPPPVKTRTRFMNAIRSRPPPVPPKTTRPNRADSTSSNNSVAKIAATSFPFRDGSTNSDFQLTNLQSSVRHSCMTCSEADEQVTALPRMGCIPERPHSPYEDYTRHHHAQQQRDLV